MVVLTDGLASNKTAAELSFLAAQKQGVIVLMVLVGFWATMMPPPNAWLSFPPISVPDGFADLKNQLYSIQNLVCIESQPIPEATKVPAAGYATSPPGLDVTTAAPCMPAGRSDLMFLLDASGSISQGDWDSFRKFTDEVIAALPINSNQMNAGVLEFSTAVRAAPPPLCFAHSRPRDRLSCMRVSLTCATVRRCTWAHGAHSQVRTVSDITSSSAGLRSQFKAAVSAKPQGKTNVHLGLDLAVSKLLEKDKSAIKRILLFTDGMPSNMTAAETSFLAAKAAGVIVQARLRFLCIAV